MKYPKRYYNSAVRNVRRVTNAIGQFHSLRARNNRNVRGYLGRRMLPGEVEHFARSKSGSQQSTAVSRVSGRRVRSYKKGKSIRRLRKNYKKTFKKSIRKLVPYLGFESRYESGGIATDDYCVTIGHSTAISQLRRAFFSTIVKKLLVKLGINVPSNQVPIQNLTLNDVFYIYYSRSDNTVSTPLSFISHTCTGTDTLLSISESFVNGFLDTAVAGAFKRFRLEYCLFFANGAGDLTSIRIPLRDATVKWYSSSVLKMQNRTSDGVDNQESDDLVAQHCRGKSYYGNGNGLYPKATSELQASNFNIAILSNNNTGLIGGTNYGNLNTPNLREPQDKSFFINVKSSSNVHIMPGHVKRSYLNGEYSQNINDFFDIIMTYDNSQVVADNAKRNPIFWRKCQYRAFMIEKEIETESGAPLYPVKIAYEIDNTVGVIIDTHMDTYTNREHVLGTTLVTAGL